MFCPAKKKPNETNASEVNKQTTQLFQVLGDNVYISSHLVIHAYMYVICSINVKKSDLLTKYFRTLRHDNQSN